jgi:hypothetical protein
MTKMVRLYGVATGDMGVGRDGEPTGNYTRGMELHGKYVADRRRGARLASKQCDLERFDLAKDARPPEIRHWSERTLGGEARKTTGPGASIPSAGRWI